MSEIIIFKCGFCKDGIGRTRKGLRDHLGENHLRNEFFNTGTKKEKRHQIIRETQFRENGN